MTIKNIRDTSKETYFSSAVKLNDRERIVLDEIRRVPKLTAFEYTTLIFHRNDPNYVRPRITDLQNKGLVRASGKRKCQISKNTCYVWECCQDE